MLVNCPSHTSLHGPHTDLFQISEEEIIVLVQKAWERETTQKWSVNMLLSRTLNRSHDSGIRGSSSSVTVSLFTPSPLTL